MPPLLVFVLILELVCTIEGYKQNDYIVVFERLEVLDFDKKYINEFSARTFKFNRTHAAINATLTLNANLGRNLRVNVETFKSASNEYRPFPISYETNICQARESDEFGINAEAYACGLRQTCPLDKGSYGICNWSPEFNKFPPYVPVGSYKFALVYKYFKEDIAHFNVHVNALKLASNEYRPFPISFESNLCETIEKDDFGLKNIYRCGDAVRCPLNQGNYTICNWAPEYHKFPPYVPIGSYKLELTYRYFKEDVAISNVFVTIRHLI